MTANSHVIRTERFDEIARIIERDIPLLIDCWCRRAVEEQPGAQRLHHDALLDELPRFLREVAEVLDAEDENNAYSHCRLAREHGKQRWQVGWSLSEVVRDYRILRLVVLDHLENRLARPLRLREVQAVGLVLDDAIEVSVQQYVHSRDGEVQQLQQSLEDADRRKNEFLATLAHELRNPLAPLRNSLAVVRMGGDSPASFRQVREIMERQVEQMTRLVEDLLDVTRISKGKLTLRREQVDLRRTAEETVLMNAPLREARRHQITMSLPAEPVWVEGDHARLVQILVNLLNNAAKYTQEGGRIELAITCQDNETVARVKDNGIGIPPEKLSHIFDLFTQIDLGQERDQGGLGIGLTLVRQLVELHRGTISASSAGVGQGSEFVVRLPAVCAGLQNSSQETPKPEQTAGRQVLIVEDNADARESLAVLLRLFGHRVVTAENAQRGLEVALAERPQFALLDIGLPDLSGYDLARQLRQALGDSVFLVALTGHSQPEDRQHALEAGFHTHLVKPVEPDDLQTLLASAAPRGGQA